MHISPDTFTFESPNGFIVIDGVNGAGKTTLQNTLIAFLESRDIPAVKTREPGGTDIGKQIRQLVLESKEKPAELCEVLLFAADRAEHVQKVLKPAQSDGKCVVCDRYYYSTVAFQGYGRGIDLEMIQQLNQVAIDGLVPDLVILLDLEPEEGLKRTLSRASEEGDNFEKEKLDFHTRLREGFLKLAEELPEPFLVVNAEQSADNVWAEIKPVVEQWASAWESANGR